MSKKAYTTRGMYKSLYTFKYKVQKKYLNSQKYYLTARGIHVHNIDTEPISCISSWFINWEQLYA